MSVIMSPTSMSLCVGHQSAKSHKHVKKTQHMDFCFYLYFVSVCVCVLNDCTTVILNHQVMTEKKKLGRQKGILTNKQPNYHGHKFKRVTAYVHTLN